MKNRQLAERSQTRKSKKIICILPFFFPLLLSTMEKASKTQRAGAALPHRVDRVEEHLNLLLSQPLSDVYSKLPLNKKAQFQVLMAFSLNTLFQSESRKTDNIQLIHSLISLHEDTRQRSEQSPEHGPTCKIIQEKKKNTSDSRRVNRNGSRNTLARSSTLRAGLLNVSVDSSHELSMTHMAWNSFDASQ